MFIDGTMRRVERRTNTAAANAGIEYKRRVVCLNNEAVRDENRRDEVDINNHCMGEAKGIWVITRLFQTNVDKVN